MAAQSFRNRSLDLALSLSLGVGLILLVSLLMLSRDLGNRSSARMERKALEEKARADARAKPGGPEVPQKVWRIAIMQHGSMQVLDEIAEGMVDALTEAGFVPPDQKVALIQKGYSEGPRATVRRLNAQMDVSIAQAIASQLLNGDYDLVLTISTVSLQTLAKANSKGQVIQVFAGVADPWSALPELRRNEPLYHPRHLIGLGSMQPVDQALRLAKKIHPELTKLGVPYNTSEANSRAQIDIARVTCKELGIELLEASAESPSAVQDAVLSLLSRGSEAIMIPGDITLMSAVDVVIKASQQAGVPVFTLIPPNVKRGALFDLGADYMKIGQLGGGLAVEVMNGRDPATLPIINVMPEQLTINEKALVGLRQQWSIPADLIAKATILINEEGKIVRDKPARIPTAAPVPDKTAATNAVPAIPATNLPANPSATNISAPPDKPSASATPPPLPALPKPQEGRIYKLGLLYFGPEPGVENCMRGLMDGLKLHGFTEGKNLTVTRLHAAGEISNIPALIQKLDNDDIDVMMPLSTPCVTAACSMAKQKPVVFAYCYDPIAAGAGKSFTDKLPNVTGVGSFPPLGKTVEVITQIIPDVKTVGTIYNTSEANSRKAVEVAREEFKKRGITLIEMPATNTSEVFQAAQALAARRPQVVWITGDNTVQQAFPAIMRVMNESRIPVVVNDIEEMRHGPVAAVGLGFYESGTAGARVLARVLLGERTEDIPIENVSRDIVQINPEVAAAFGLVIPEALLKESAEGKAVMEKMVVPAPVVAPLKNVVPEQKP